MAERLVPQPFLKWAGGKRKIAADIIRYAPEGFTRYVEPMVGGGAVFFELRRQGYEGPALLSDINEFLINAYRQVKRHPRRIVAVLQRWPVTREFFQSISKQVPPGKIEQAAWFIYLNRTAYNGLWRVNSRNEFNVPWGRYKNPNVADLGRLLAAQAALRNTEILCAPVSRVLDELVLPGDWVYLDPPYVPLSATANFTGYIPGGFGLDEQRALLEAMRKLANRGIPVCLSNSDTPWMRDVLGQSYPEFEVRSLQAPRTISCRADTRRPVTELLIFNYHPGD